MWTKLRIIKQSHYPVHGVAIPKEIAQFFQGCDFKIEYDITKKTILLISGTSIEPTKKDIERYKFEDVRIK